MNGRLDTLQAAVLLAKLEVFADEIERRQAIAARYTELLDGAVTVPQVPKDLHSVWAQYSIRIKGRRDLWPNASKPKAFRQRFIIQCPCTVSRPIGATP